MYSMNTTASPFTALSAKVTVLKTNPSVPSVVTKLAANDKLTTRVKALPAPIMKGLLGKLRLWNIQVPTEHIH